MATIREQSYSEQNRDERGLSARHDGERSVGSLVSELVGESSALVRAELTLARREMEQHARSAQRGLASMGAGAAVLAAGLLALVACAILALTRVMPDWQAALVVGVLVTAIGAIMLAVGKHKAVSQSLRPERTLHSLTEMEDMARRQGRHAARKWQ
jgi:Putative Actinobacterial Holin-X, holin superfamily III